MTGQNKGLKEAGLTIKDDERGRYSICRKEYPSGQAFYMFEHLEGEVVSPLRNESFRIELKKETDFDEVKRFEEWLNRSIETIAYTPD